MQRQLLLRPVLEEREESVVNDPIESHRHWTEWCTPALKTGEIKQIVDLLLDALRKRLADRNLQLELSEPVRELVAREGFDPVFGARPLKRYLQRELETKIGRALIAGEVPDGSTLEIGVEGGGLRIAVRERAEVTAGAEVAA